MMPELIAVSGAPGTVVGVVTGTPTTDYRNELYVSEIPDSELAANIENYLSTALKGGATSANPEYPSGALKRFRVHRCREHWEEVEIEATSAEEAERIGFNNLDLIWMDHFEPGDLMNVDLYVEEVEVGSKEHSKCINPV